MTYEFLDIIKRKIPLLTLLIQTMIVNIFFRECISDENQIIGFWVYFPILCLFCLVWELIYVLIIFSKDYSHKSLNKRVFFGTITAIISLCTFCTTSYYIEEGRPFSCIFEYNSVVATVLFYSNIVIIIILSLYEHYVWGILEPLLPLYVQNKNLSSNFLMNQKTMKNDDSLTFN
jgi:hypothetical protein